ncbi:MAG TPA: UDP-glucose 4-epimerase GalE [Agitococcus sp.]|nr:UDP-glucose 4-epimerase GalE [Agitococcus sp.]HNB19894.1 UDP-glucose 4-epimerase GalE [Agitococcus sp.]HNC86014.1 UDP-glucose 4-epimerase GalE [Agitococcus sp.]HNI61958.1 UDP-glucose 4-epimerase GalE [Agitococcus sp.]HNJ84961.1 UDP-glucose 4-epimerase GalE [Agitococcus sp.]
MILLTGGAGYIGSHTALELLAAGFDILVLDNLSNSKLEAINRTRQLANKNFEFIEGDIRDRQLLDKLFRSYPITAVVHFAGLKAVGESVQKPLYYYDNNVSGSVVLFEAMTAANIKTIVFSSSATVYGDPHTVPIKEDFPLSTTNPYGASKLMIENILRDVKVADNSWRIALLRYFNPTGAHESGLIGEDPNGIPNNLMPYIAQVAVGKRSHLQVFGGDYATHDGTGVRDYIHVVDLAKGHVKALQYLEQNQELVTVNLGTGKGYSVLDMLKAMEKAAGKTIAYQIVERRAGDIASCYADPQYAFNKIGWQAEFDQERMCSDMWRWQSQNPNGYN